MHLYGLSYHFERARARDVGLTNEVNTGLGLRYRIPGESYDWAADVGFFRDSARNTASHAGAGVLLKPTERVRLGAALVVIQSDTYHSGNPFLAPIPIVAYEWRALSLNMAYSPRVGGVNDVNALLFWLTLWPKAF